MRDGRSRESPQEGKEDWEAPPEGWTGLGGPPGGPGGVERPFWRAQKGQDGREW